MRYYGGTYGDNGHKYEFEIVTGGDGSQETELTIVASGLQVSYKGELFDPIKGTGASIRVLTDEIPTDIYASKALDVPVVIYDDGVEMWRGYVTPNCYDQDYKPGRVPLTIECRDCIAALKDIKYNNPEALPYDSLQHYITRAVMTGMGISEDEAEARIELVQPWSDVNLSECHVMDANWYDENQEPMKWYEVLEQVLLYSDLQLVMWRGKVSVKPMSQQADSTDIDDYSARVSPTMSLTDCVQKVRVNCSMYSDDVIYGSWDNDDADLVKVDKEWEHYDGSSESWSEQIGFYKNKKIEQYAYNSESLAEEELNNSVEGAKVQSAAYMVKAQTREVKNNGRAPLWSDIALEAVNDNEMKTYIVLTKNESSTNAGKMSSYDQLPMMKLGDGIGRLFTGSETLVISGSATITYNEFFLLNPDAGGSPRVDVGPFKKLNYDVETGIQNLYLNVQIKIGDYYAKREKPVAASGVTWTTTPSVVRVHLSNSNAQPEKGHSDYSMYNYYNKAHSFRNTINWYNGIDLSGCGVNLENALNGDVEITLLGFHTDQSANKDWGSPVSSVWLSDFKVGIARWKDYNQQYAIEHDIYYENVIDDDNAREAEELTLKVCTDVGTGYNRATVYKLVGGKCSYNGEVTSAVSGEKAIAEHHIVASRYEQYKQPRQSLRGSWLKYVAELDQGLHSRNIGKSYRMTKGAIDLARSETEMVIEEVV